MVILFAQNQILLGALALDRGEDVYVRLELLSCLI